MLIEGNLGKQPDNHGQAQKISVRFPPETLQLYQGFFVQEKIKTLQLYQGFFVQEKKLSSCIKGFLSKKKSKLSSCIKGFFVQEKKLSSCIKGFLSKKKSKLSSCIKGFFVQEKKLSSCIKGFLPMFKIWFHFLLERRSNLFALSNIRMISRSDPRCIDPALRLRTLGFVLKKAEKMRRQRLELGVSKNNGTPKSSILLGFSIINHPFWGTPIFGNTQLLRTIGGSCLNTGFFPVDTES